MLIRAFVVLTSVIVLSVASPASRAAADPPPDPPVTEVCARQSFGFEEYTVCQRWHDGDPSDPVATVDVYGIRSAIELPPEPVEYELRYLPDGGSAVLVATGGFGTDWIETTPAGSRTVACGATGRASMRVRWSPASAWTDFITTGQLLVGC